MIKFFLPAAILLVTFSGTKGQTPTPMDPKALVQKIQGELGNPFPPPDANYSSTVPRGEMITGVVHSTVYPGMDGEFQVYVPGSYDPAKPACLLVALDGLGNAQIPALDNLIAKKDIPMMIAIGIHPGMVWRGPEGDPKRQAMRYNRSFMFDSVNQDFPDYVINEVLPAALKLKTKDGRAINISLDPNDRMTMGASSGGIGAFTLAWHRPDQFRRVFSYIGTFVPMRGGNEYSVLVRKTDPKPLRIFLEDGSSDAWNPLFGMWYDANLNMESALSFSGYDVAHAWGTHGHDGGPGSVIFPDVMRWLWRDYPAPIQAKPSNNNMLGDLTLPNEGWTKIPQTFQGVAGLAANAKGEVFLSDAPAGAVYRLGTDDKPGVFQEHGPGIVGEVFGPDGTLYALVPSQKKILAFDDKGASRILVDGIAGHAITVTHDGTIYVTEPGEHAELPSKIWQIKPTGEKKQVDEGLFPASGIAVHPNGTLLYTAESSSQWVYSYVVQPDGTLADRQPFYWLHSTDLPQNSGAEDLAQDIRGNLYVATRMGVQIADLRGEVDAILPLPTPCGPVRSLCFGGEHFDMLYVTDGVQVFKRHMKVAGFAPWSAPVEMPVPGGA
jgi:gluconolactonase